MMMLAGKWREEFSCEGKYADMQFPSKIREEGMMSTVASEGKAR